MADLRPRRLRLWPWRQKSATSSIAAAPPTVADFSQKIIDLVQLERGIAALYYYLPDDALAAYAQALCQRHHTQRLLEAGVDRDLRLKDAVFASWQAVSGLWYSDVWQPGEILATFGYRTIEALRPQPEPWSVIVDPRAQFYGVAAATDEQNRYWLVLVVGQKGAGGGLDTATAAR